MSTVDLIFTDHFHFPASCGDCGAGIRYAQIGPSTVAPTALPWCQYAVYDCGADLRWEQGNGTTVTMPCPTKRPFCLMCGRQRHMKDSLFCTDVCGRRWADARIRVDEARMLKGEPST
jgi:hypothetical protein